MIQSQSQIPAQTGLERFDLATPVLILLRAELMALKQVLPGLSTASTLADDAAIEALADNLPV